MNELTSVVADYNCFLKSKKIKFVNKNMRNDIDYNELFSDF